MRQLIRQVFLCMALIGAAPQLAAAADSFSIMGVEVDATADSAAAAQGEAQKIGFRLAFQALLDKHVMRADQPRLDPIDEQSLSAMIQSFRVTDEKRSPTRYLATMSVQFKADLFRAWLSRYAVATSETKAKPTLVMAVFAPKGAYPALWEEFNSWRAAIADRGAKPGDVVPLRFADGDVEDLQTVNVKQAMKTEQAALGKLAAKYRTDRYAVVALRPGTSVATLSIFVKDPFGPRRWTVRVNRSDNPKSDNEFLHYLAQRAQTELDEDWKRRTLILATNEGEIDLFVPITGLRDWQAVERDLTAAAGIRDINVAEMSTKMVLIKLAYQGGMEQLQVSLQDQGLRIVTDVSGRASLIRGVRPGGDRGPKYYPAR